MAAVVCGLAVIATASASASVYNALCPDRDNDGVRKYDNYLNGTVPPFEAACLTPLNLPATSGSGADSCLTTQCTLEDCSDSCEDRVDDRVEEFVKSCPSTCGVRWRRWRGPPRVPRADAPRALRRTSSRS